MEEECYQCIGCQGRGRTPVTLTYTTGSPRHEDYLGEISSILTLFLYSFMVSINLSANESGIHLVNTGHFGGTHILWHLASGTQE